MTASEKQELTRDLADRDWWLDLARVLGLGRLLGWTYRNSALFATEDCGGKTIDVSGAWLTVAIQLYTRLKGTL